MHLLFSSSRDLFWFCRNLIFGIDWTDLSKYYLKRILRVTYIVRRIRILKYFYKRIILRIWFKWFGKLFTFWYNFYLLLFFWISYYNYTSLYIWLLHFVLANVISWIWIFSLFVKKIKQNSSSFCPLVNYHCEKEMLYLFFLSL